MIDYMIKLGKADNINFLFEGLTGNTTDAHRLIYYAG